MYDFSAMGSFYRSGATRSLKHRQNTLDKLKQMIISQQDAIAEALRSILPLDNL